MTAHGQRDPLHVRHIRSLRGEIDRLGMSRAEFSAYIETPKGTNPGEWLNAYRYRQGAAARAEAGARVANGDIKGFDINDPDPEDFAARREGGVPMTDAERGLIR